VPSPGSSNSQDSFPAGGGAGGGGSGSMDGYQGYPGYAPGGNNADYPGSQRGNQPAAPSPIQGRFDGPKDWTLSLIWLSYKIRFSFKEN